MLRVAVNPRYIFETLLHFATVFTKMPEFENVLHSFTETKFVKLTKTQLTSRLKFHR